MPGVRKPNAWLGSRNAFTQLHQDVLHNFVLQLHGRKKFTLFAPADAPFLARETLEARPNYSQIPSTARVDAAKFPAFAQATPFVVELGPGDVLVLPAYWWHEVLTLESTLMLNYWFAPTLGSVRAVDVERLIYTAGVARRHVLGHLDLRGFASDHALIEQLLAQHLGLLAAVLLADAADD